MHSCSSKTLISVWTCQYHSLLVTTYWDHILRFILISGLWWTGISERLHTPKGELIKHSYIILSGLDYYDKWSRATYILRYSDVIKRHVMHRLWTCSLQLFFSVNTIYHHASALLLGFTPFAGTSYLLCHNAYFLIAASKWCGTSVSLFECIRKFAKDFFGLLQAHRLKCFIYFNQYSMF
jgi:hypothetical protein